MLTSDDFCRRLDDLRRDWTITIETAKSGKVKLTLRDSRPIFETTPAACVYIGDSLPLLINRAWAGHPADA